jgi:hypothetical protein
MTTESLRARTIEALCLRSHQVSKEKGWVNDTDERPYATSIALMHSELSEALEEWRAHEPVGNTYYTVRGVKITKEQRLASVEPPAADIASFKPEGIPIELADLAIRICQRVGTDGNGKVFELEFHKHSAPPFRDFEHFLAETHLMLSLSYRASLGGYDPHGTLTYLSEALVYTLDFCKQNNVDLWAAIDEKEAFNRTRPARHGGKKC